MGTDLLFPAACAFGATLALVPVTRRIGFLDVPSERSSHRSPVPRTGGIGLFLGVAIAAAVAGVPSLFSYAIPATLFFLVGLADDVRRLPARVKVVLQAGAAAIAVSTGLRWGGGAIGPFGEMTFGIATPFMTGLWFFAVGIVVNFVDGIDLITCATTAVLLAAGAGGGAGPGDGALYAAVAGGVLGLAAWNASPARVFAGDAGTHLLGFLVASVACRVEGAVPPLAALPWAVASAPLLPGVIDVGWGIAAKVRRGIPVTAAHNDHLYQRLTKVGWSHRGVAIRYAVLEMVALLLVARLSNDIGLWPTVAGGGAVLAVHLADGVRVSRILRFRHETS